MDTNPSAQIPGGMARSVAESSRGLRVDFTVSFVFELHTVAVGQRNSGRDNASSAPRRRSEVSRHAAASYRPSLQPRGVSDDKH